MPVPEDLLQTHPGGLTADQVGQRAAATSFNVKASLETMRAAEARVDQQWVAFLPRLTATAKYTRLSSFTPPVFGSSQGSSVGTTIPADNGLVPIPAGTQLYAVPGISIPLVLDNYVLQANLTVPISDYFLKTNENYSAATKSAEAARFDVGASKATALSNGKVAYYSWLLARGGLIVAVQALNDQRTHLNDARNQFQVGNASKADVLRAETAVASAELQVETAKNAADLAETQMRIAIHAPPGQQLLPAEGLDVVPPAFQGNLQALVQEGLTNRYEVKSAETNALANRKLASAQNAAAYPTVSAFADGIYANPNPRFFPQTQEWHATWDLGAQAVWSPNDIALGGAGKKDYEARAASLEANAVAVREGVEVEVTQMYQQVRQYDIALDSTKRELASAQEAYRVARELFNNGRGTSTTLADAETDLTRARLDALNATVNARVARVRLDHAVGRDLKAAGAATP
jgi:outer membrane protein TolC